MKPGTDLTIKDQVGLHEHINSIMTFNELTGPDNLEAYVEDMDQAHIRWCRRELISSSALLNYYLGSTPRTFQDKCHTDAEIRKVVDIGRETAQRFTPYLRGSKKETTL